MKYHIVIMAFVVGLINIGFAQTRIQGVGIQPLAKVEYYAFDAAQMDYVSVGDVKSNNQGVFSFTISDAAPNLYRIDVDGEASVLLSLKQEKEIVIDYSSEKVNIEGSDHSARMQTFGAEIQALQAQYFGTLKKQLDEAMETGDKELAEQLMNKANAAIPAFVKELREKILFFEHSPAMYFAVQFLDFNKEQAFINERWIEMETHLPHSPTTKALAKQLAKSNAAQIGLIPPVFKATDQNGQDISLDQFRGKLVLVDFWASWCRACRVEHPQFVAIYKKYNRADFDIISISSDEQKIVWETAIEKDGIEAWNHIWDATEQIFQQYNISSLPQNMLIDKTGKVRAKNINAEELADILSQEIK